MLLSLFMKILFAICIMAMLCCRISGIKPFIVMSGSMEPAISTGALCFVHTKAAYDRVQKGDIVAYKISTGTYVTHRVVERTEAGMVTKGDANEAADGSLVTWKNFVGKTLFSIPFGGYIMKYLQQPAVLAGICGIAMIIPRMKKQKKSF